MARPKRASLSNFAETKPGAAPTPAAAASPAEDAPRRGMTLRLREDAWRQLKVAALDRGETAHDLLLEALNDWFTKQGKPPIA